MNEKLTMQRAQVELTANGLERRQLDGREYAIVPATIIVAGVLNGELVPADALADFAEGWNGRPIPIGHPVDDAGNYIIANHPTVIEQSVIGAFYNANFDGQRIRGEMWLDVAKAQRLGDVALELLRRLEAGEVVEVSTGYYAHVDAVAGTYNGKPYTGVQADLVPDHIALLPDEVGACSVADGCGAGRWNIASNIIPESLTLRVGDRLIMFVSKGEIVMSNQVLVTNQEVATEPMTPVIEAVAEPVNEIPSPGAPAVAINPASDELAGLIAEFGGVQGLRDALAAITANAQSQRATITARLLANRQNTFDTADLGKLDLAHLIKLDRALTPANYAGQGGAIFNGVQDDGFRAYQAPAMK